MYRIYINKEIMKYGQDIDIINTTEFYADDEIAELELMKQELEAQLHEDNMRTNADYFCEWVLDNLFRIGGVNNPTSLRDMIELLNKEIMKYGQDIDSVYEYFKEI